MRLTRSFSVGVLVLLNVSIMCSLRALPLVAAFGLSSIFYFSLVLFSFLLPCAFIAAELGATWPDTGGIYDWVRKAFGSRWGFFAIWMQWAHNLAWYPVILSFVGANIAYLIDPALAQNKGFMFSIILGGYWGMSLLNLLGIRFSGWFSSAGVLIGTLLPAIFIMGLGLAWLVTGHPSHIHFHWDALIPRGMQADVLFFAGLLLSFAGLEVSISYIKQVKNPQKSYPKAILISALVVSTTLIFGALAIAVVIPKEDINLVEGIMSAFQLLLERVHWQAAMPVVVVCLAIGAIAEVNSWIIGPVRSLYATAAHGDLPPIFHKVNRHGVPTRLLLVQAIIVTFTSLVVLYLPTVSSAFWILTALSAQSYLIMYLLLFAAGIRLRFLYPKKERPFLIPGRKNKGMWLCSLLGSLSSLAVLGLTFMPPAQFYTGSSYFYQLFLSGSLLVMCAIPWIISSCKKAHWVQPIKLDYCD